MSYVLDVSKKRVSKINEIWDLVGHATNVAIEEAETCEDRNLQGKFITIAESLIYAKTKLNDLLEIEVNSLDDENKRMTNK